MHATYENKNEVHFKKPKSIVETVAEFLRESIVIGNLKPGEKINNKEIIEKLGISSIPLREAIRILEKEGLINSRPGKGSWVASALRKDLDETFQMREMIETFAVDLIKARVKADGSIKEELELIDLDGEADSLGHESCINFHNQVIQLAGNTKLLYIYGILSNNIRRYQRMSYAIRHEEGVCVEEHLDILTLLIKGNYEEAKFSIRNHLKGLKDKLLEEVDFLE